MSRVCLRSGRLKLFEWELSFKMIVEVLTVFSLVSGASSNTSELTKIDFGLKGFVFTTCDNTGRLGPTQYQCDRAYENTENNITVLTDSPFAGVQVWTVPKTTLYSITALGSSGGKGVGNTEASKGGYVSGKFNLTEGELIYMLIGQQGQSACEKTTDKIKPLCLHGLKNNPAEMIGGAGGGGGGTFVFKMDVTGEIEILLVAGGGGGKGLKVGPDPINTDGGLTTGGNGLSAYTPRNGPGAGGGWLGESTLLHAGESLLQGGKGGSTCPKAAQQMGYETSGGFGGGGGGCAAGGGAGGYSGGNVSLTDNPEHNGMGGSSYISSEAQAPLFERGNHDGGGDVEIAYIIDCPCDFLCIYTKFNELQKEYKCYCPLNYILAEDGTTCLNAEKVKKVPTHKMIGIILGSIAGVFAVSILLFLIVHYRNKRKLKALRLEHGYTNNPEYQLDRLRNPTASPHNMEYNPNYDFGGSKCTLQDLRDIPRQHLLLIRALGQGAFGEVYQGYLSNLPPEATDMPVAVKTLPALCTDQAEMDFLMEALIMSKFNHPNIVQFVGVCFEKHPRFIILELLEGGDLKSFLRECRPKHDRPSSLTMLDLAKLSLDVAKGCHYLEQNHFIHRDVAARNCLLTTKGPDRVAKIADFGMARDIYRADYYRKGGKAMLPVKWMPPEAFMDGIFTSKTDAWSFGIVLWEVFSLGYMPYPGRGNHEVMQLVTAGGRLDSPQNCPTSIYEMMVECWDATPENRPDFSTIIKKLQKILEDPEVIHAPLLVNYHPMGQDRELLHSCYPDGMDLPMKGMEPTSTSSLDDLLRPLDLDYQPPISIHQRSSPFSNGGTEYVESVMQASNQEQSSHGGRCKNKDTVRAKDYHVSSSPKVKKSWQKNDVTEDESSSLLQSDIEDSNLKRISTASSYSADSGQSSLDSSKLKNLEKEQDCKLSASPLNPNVLHLNPGDLPEVEHHPKRSVIHDSVRGSTPDVCHSSNRNLFEDNKGKSTTDSHLKSTPTPRSSRIVYENLKTLPVKESSANSGHSTRTLPWQHDSRPTTSTNNQEKGDSGIEVDLRSSAKSQSS